ncbi:MAG TPA: HEAT repeat domain-containing protein [Vicinamibacterales bacterium]|nr:HEAT repeat domain-containing protein [Vicinamibacterales bacterium]
MTRSVVLVAVTLLPLVSALNVRGAGLQPGKSPVPPQLPIADAIKQLGDLDYTKRTRAAASLRRRAPAEVAPALLEALERNADGYVRFRVLVLLSAFNNPRVPDVMRGATFDPNDRLREVAYSYFEGHPDPSLLGTFLEALDKETSEFVRPSLVRAVAALGADPRARQVMLREVMRGQDFFRSGVIEALGDHKATYAVDALITIAGLEGPLQDDAALALGKLGDKKALPVLAGLQRTAPKDTQPAIAAAICLLGVNCEAHRGFLVRSLTFAKDTAGFQALVRSAAAALASLATSGDREAASALIDVGVPSQDPARAPIALASATLAVRNPALLIALLESRADRRAALSLVVEGFDMLEEDYLEEQFFAAVRKAYWAAPEGAATRATAQEIIGTLDF